MNHANELKSYGVTIENILNKTHRWSKRQTLELLGYELELFIWKKHKQKIQATEEKHRNAKSPPIERRRPCKSHRYQKAANFETDKRELLGTTKRE